MKYTLLRAYDDCTTMTEQGDDIVAMLEAAAIYLRDRTCMTVKIWELGNPDVFILNYWRV